MGGEVVAPSAPTCGKRTLDYFVVSAKLSHIVVGTQIVASSGTKPHSAVRLVLASGGWARQVRKIRGPRLIRALPEGPRGPDTPQPAPPTSAMQAQLDVAYQEWVTAVEHQTLPFLALAGSAAAAATGRAHGHAVVWRCGLGPPASPTPFAYHASRQWRLLAAWLRQAASLVRAGATMAGDPAHRFRAWQQLVALISSAKLWRALEVHECTRCPLARTQAATIPQALAWVSLISRGAFVSTPALLALAAQAEGYESKLRDAEARAASIAWRKWLDDGVAKRGGRVIHRWSRAATGWIPAPLVDEIDVHDAWAHDEDAASLGPGTAPSAVTAVVACPEQQVDVEAAAWSRQWACGSNTAPVVFPPLAQRPPTASVAYLVAAIRTFPADTAIGTDAYHPRVLLRLGPSLLPALLKVLFLCELLGSWPGVITDVLIALLPKLAGGFRPIGISPTLVRVWFRLRAPYVREWERTHARLFFFAGEARGADVALWLQAAHLEHAALSRRESAATLIDLVNAFDHVSHTALRDQAAKWDYPAWILRLSIAANRLGRRISIGGIVSAVIAACRGITAGSTFATTELRVLVLAALDLVHRAFPSLPMHICVDDMFIHAEGTRQRVCRSLPVATRLLVIELNRVGLQVSDTKSEGIASSPSLALTLSAALRDLRIRFGLGCASRWEGTSRRPGTAARPSRMPAFRRLRPGARASLA